MKRLIKSTMMVVCGLCWLAFALAIGLFLLPYIAEGAGLQIFGFGVSSTSVLIGLVHVVGFVAAGSLCFVIGVGLYAHGLVPAPQAQIGTTERPKAHFSFIRHFIASRPGREDAEATLRCVRCRVALAACVHICPECGWTQPYDNAG